VIATRGGVLLREITSVAHADCALGVRHRERDGDKAWDTPQAR
jgi:hypothetical protein